MYRFCTIVLPAAALIFALTPHPLYAQDAVDGLLPRGPGPRGQQTQRSGLPPTQPTAIPVPAPAPAPSQPDTPPAARNLNERPTTRARVIFTSGLLEVRADNSGLLQILHDVSRITGMAITGGIADQHIFGDYGPAVPSTVLSTLLDGTGANMLLRQDPVTGAPIELVLTQRAGGSASSPNGPGFDDSPFPPETSPAPAKATPAPVAQTVSKPAPPDPNAPHPTNYVPGSPFNPQEPPPQNSVNSAPPTPAASTATQPSGAAATPEGIYQKLIELQKAKDAAAQPTTPPNTTTPK